MKTIMDDPLAILKFKWVNNSIIFKWFKYKYYDELNLSSDYKFYDDINSSDQPTILINFFSLLSGHHPDNPASST